MKYEVQDGSVAAADRRRAEDKSGGQDKEEMMKKMEAAGTPGPAHKVLEALVGNWKAEVKCWQEPGGQSNVSQATAKCSWILNGRFLEEEFHGEMMGKRFTGRSWMGYDNVKQKYNSVWVSDMQTSMFCSEGKGDNKTITLEGTSSCAATGRTDAKMKAVFRFLGADKHIFEMYDGNDKQMEITYTRQ
jgi:hypothetical protein